MRQNLGVAAAGPFDTATKSYVDSTPGVSVGLCPVGWYLAPQYVLTTAASAPLSGAWFYMPITIGFSQQTFDAFVTYATTAQSGGTGTTMLFGLYPDDGTGYPNTATPITTATSPAMTAVGAKLATLNTAVVLNPGLYWIGVLYYQGSTAPTTAPQFNAISNTIMILGTSTTVSFGSANRGFRTSSTSYTSYPSGTTPTSNMTTNSGATCTLVGLRRSA
jgi:hypothetical protein